jgi:hypothetical protein
MRYLVAFVAAFALTLAAPVPAERGQLSAARAGTLQPTAAATKKKARHSRRGRRAGSMSRDAYDPDLCSVINGWRAFQTRDPRGYFDTGRVCCCR